MAPQPYFPNPKKPLIEDVARDIAWHSREFTQHGPSYDPATGKYPPDKPEPTFNRACRTVLEESLKVQAERGNEYGDSWTTENMNPIFLRAVIKKINGGAGFSDTELRLIMLAALVDAKDSRISNGDLKRDSVIDGINYRAVLIQLLEEYENPPTEPF